MKFSKREVVQSEGSGLFLKLKDGESVTGIFRGEVFEFYSKWVESEGKSYVTTFDDPEGRPKFRLNFVMNENGKMVAKIWDFSVSIYNKLADIHEEYPLETTKVKITRRGVKKDTDYTILPLLKEKIGPQTMKEIEAVPLNVLEHR